MSYFRVIPRDFFNEGNLLKCYGQLYLNLERAGMEDCLRHGGEPFLIDQDSSDGSTTILNVHLVVRGKTIPLSRPLNSREPYPLYATPDLESDPIPVFTDTGDFSADMRHFLGLDEREESENARKDYP